MKYWQHSNPINCPKNHSMIWLGSLFWICSICKIIYVEDKPTNQSV